MEKKIDGKHLQLLKAEVIHLLEKADDESTLVKVIKVLQESEEGEPNWWETLTNEQQEELDRAEEEIKDPKNLVSHEEAMLRARTWLKDCKSNEPNWWDQLDQP